MNSIKEHSVHLWQVFVPELVDQINNFLPLLNSAEHQRAARFRFPIHRERFIVARAMLRRILSFYMCCLPEAIEFMQGERGKPYLQNNPEQLQFNVSHSADWVVYALTKHAEIGVDIEKVRESFDDAVAKRFFSAAEYAALTQLDQAEKIKRCYRVWASKEAIIKALGAGLYAPLADFSVDLFAQVQTVMLQHGQYHLENFTVDAEYQAVFATLQRVDEVCVRKTSLVFT